MRTSKKDLSDLVKALNEAKISKDEFLINSAYGKHKLILKTPGAGAVDITGLHSPGELASIMYAILKVENIKKYGNP